MRYGKGTAMRIIAKGQVTIPADIRKKAEFLPGTEVEFAYEGNGVVRLFRVNRSKARGEKLVERPIKTGRKYPRR